MPADSTSPDVEGISVLVDLAPGGIPAGSPIEAGHLNSIDKIVSKSRSVKKYPPLNNKAYNEIVALGSSSEAPLSIGVLYDPEASEGINTLETAYDDNIEVQITLELNNALNATGTGTKITSLCKVSSFDVSPDGTDGKYISTVTIEKIGVTTITPATSGV